MRLVVTAFLLICMQQNFLVNLSDKSTLKNWYIVNDGVMGGLSKGTFSINDNGHGAFKGEISLDNNGGFSSVRCDLNSRDVSSFSVFVLKVKGDGKKYQFRVKSSNRQRYSYVYEFKTSGDWQTIEILFANMYPTFRGYRLDLSNFPGKTVSEIGLLFGNKKEESFNLELDYIALK